MAFNPFNFRDRRWNAADRRARFYGRGIAKALYYGAPGVAAYYGAKYYNKPSAIKARNQTMRSIKSGVKLRRTKRKTFPKKVKSQIKELKRLAESDMGRLVYRDMAPARLLAGVNAQACSAIAASDTSILEAVIAQLRYYDPSAPSTLVTADGATGTYQKEFYFKRIYSKITYRNNYQSPVLVKSYCCVPKDDTNITPFVAWTNGLTDGANGSYSDMNSYPTDSQQFQDLYKIVSSKTKLLNPGQELVCTHSEKPFQYDPSLTDSHSLSYQTRNKNFLWMTIVSGCVGHDTSLDEQGFLAAGVDIIIERVFEVHYSAGADIRFVYTTNSLDTFTNGGVYSSKPVADNIGYSVS